MNKVSTMLADREQIFFRGIIAEIRQMKKQGKNYPVTI
jgi:hypothetical protein